jgi:allophanate hydrolase
VDRFALAVVGAHMDGMPLNRDLVAMGATFLRRTTTTLDYRFYALAGGPPRRPGLLRVADGEGAAIEVEVWSLDAAGFGRFVAHIPPPLGIGTLRLADGSTPKGFLVEPQGIVGAEDITSYGGWRRYMAALAVIAT